jgi:large subunit ribosomal protein L32
MVNRMRHTRGHTANRRSHHALKAGNLSLCPKCGAPKLNHAICMNCGYYKDRNVVDVQAALIKKEKKMKERNKVGGSASSSK